MGSVHVWKSELYDNKLGYVSEFGKGVVELLNPTKGERILDLGCGTGDLAYEINQTGAAVTGLDLSDAMIEKAQKKYPDIHFIAGNAENFTFEKPFDAVFSNAALHWMKNAENVLSCVWNSLKTNRRFVAEFGGKGNVETVIQAISEVLSEEYGIDANHLNPWYFPSIAEYSTLLEKQGFRVSYAVHFDRPTKMNDGEKGLDHWLNGLADDFFKELSESERRHVYAKIAAKAKKALFHDGDWYLDYKRLRIVAMKP
ncbi:class I SAM-dependent methyltransferase [Paenibacillus elgii]